MLVLGVFLSSFPATASEVFAEVSDTFDTASVSKALHRMGWRLESEAFWPPEDESGCWERPSMFFPARVCPDLDRRVLPSPLPKVGQPPPPVGPAPVSRRIRFATEVPQPALEWFLVQAALQEHADSAGGATPDLLAVQSSRSGWGLVGRLGLSSRWAMSHVESGSPLFTDGGPARSAAHATGWMVDVFSWGLVAAVALVPDLRMPDRLQVVAFTTGFGALTRVVFFGPPLGSALRYRNALMAGPYRWPATDHRGMPWPRD